MPTTPTLVPRDLLGRPAESVLDVVAGAPVERVAHYGFGKAALRDGLAARGYDRGSAVVLPALVPDGVVEPIRELGLEPRFYDVEIGDRGTTDLAPAPGALEAAVGPDAAALLGVHYFGFPNPGFEALAELADANGLDLVSDDAHGPLSRVDGRLLGTRGTFGVTSLHKLLPVPDGAVLYLNDGGERRDAYERARSAYAGVAEGYRREEVTFVARSLAMGLRDRSPAAATALRRLGSIRQPGPGRSSRSDGVGEPGPAGGPNAAGGVRITAERDPTATYRRAKRPMSRVSARVCARVDARAVVSGRRSTFRTWIDHLDSVPGVEPVYRRLREGVCPQACPVLAESAERAREVTDALPGTHTWPTLPAAVADTSAFPGAVAVAARLVPLPCHRAVDGAAVRRAVARLR